MKKLCSALLVIALAAVMVFPVMAAPSPNATAREARRNASVAVAGAKVTALPADVFAAAQDVVSNATHLTNLGISTSARMVSAFDLDMDMPAGQTSVTVPIKVDNVKAGTYVVVIHRMDNEAKTWEVVGQGYVGEDLTINCTFTSFSPVVVLAVDATQASAGVKAPKTGQF